MVQNLRTQGLKNDSKKKFKKKRFCSNEILGMMISNLKSFMHLNTNSSYRNETLIPSTRNQVKITKLVNGMEGQAGMKS